MKLAPLGIVVVGVLALWLLSGLLGFEMALGASLALSIALTLVLNVVLRAAR